MEEHSAHSSREGDSQRIAAARRYLPFTSVERITTAAEPAIHLLMSCPRSVVTRVIRRLGLGSFEHVGWLVVDAVEEAREDLGAVVLVSFGGVVSLASQ